MSEDLGIGVVGYGRVARRWHLPMYRRAGLPVAAICDADPAALDQAAEDWPDVPRYSSFDDLLADPAVRVVDLATGPSGRIDLIDRAVAASRHVLAQKPLSVHTDGLAALADRVRSSGVVVAVNQNGRFAPAWREATRLLRGDAVGRVHAVTHVYDTNLRWLPDPVRHGTDRFLLFDYSNHWIDISGYWLADDPVVAVQARDYPSLRHPGGELQQSMWISMETVSGASVLIRGAAAGITHQGHDFIVQGESGTLRGRVDSAAGEHLELDDGSQRRTVDLDGEWFGDGFLGAMQELLDAVRERREPLHSLADNLRTVTLVTAACRSAELDGARIEIPADHGV